MNLYKRKMQDRQKPFIRKNQVQKEKTRKEMNNQVLTFFEYKKSSHIKVYCPNLEKKKF